ncbi:23S rRNA (uracil(1939)-C(5))-methyltransferase RlmD [Virgibacillus pantothenticus]|uniref:23S rRNA (uracil(1939)-C(5))-methyltransferase RlmD n=1 Tax=Virgibacillus pantothenticus TaxID=1473 RepID=UPI001C20FCBF|nr:23S rRNA (uracil(1939)-C(5))-methyltransferase RlmD [Virgibacillus pantothenticus]MBU8568388.1 23S rRNA (uracil(1939)-C(5))-methyltransferase RlmD [Virgibacillus pantothenticus]MBU8602427.1 23S rRNA (uracil(1939)-C(5))-methyltransferase RlmD [Virgibacillus pantothenticus]MBU8636563.1 23S rRNA (uracil(1939)-C(5))-methyltransferase RlmD [Virgibacillus pantothenticus]MBU8644244.1 23S rRNA (uracil(1939)-C(5))-methyltransferase RlmD [Virgibacillus pantothenticus]MBU8648865.1 23S rRNA (uracil(193
MAKKAVPVKKNETLTLAFEDLTHEGNGVAKVNGYPLFVPYGLPGEQALVKVIKVNKNFGFGKLLEVKQASPDRVEAPCDVYYKCGGCQLQHMSYDLQLNMKRNQVKNVMRKIAHMSHVPVHPTLGMTDPWRYRNKVQIPVGEKNGELITGFFQKRSHRIIEDMDTCVIQDEVNDRMVEAVRRIANQLGITAYDESKHRGVLRHIMVRTGRETKDTMIVLVTRTDKLPEQDKLIQALTETYPHIKSIVHNVNKEITNVILGKKTKVIWGDDYIYDTIGNIRFAISAKSFYQVNPPQTKVLYEKALEYANLNSSDVVIDAYCGIGTISLFLAQQAKKVYGIEVVPEAISDAKRNAKLNGIINVEFVVGEAEKVMPWWKAQGLHPDVIIVDPPRKGCDGDFLQAMIEMQPKRIVYVSCNPSTLARDLKILDEGGYETKEVQPVDMFPQTNHVEAVSLLERKMPN